LIDEELPALELVCLTLDSDLMYYNRDGGSASIIF